MQIMIVKHVLEVFFILLVHLCPSTGWEKPSTYNQHLVAAGKTITHFKRFHNTHFTSESTEAYCIHLKKKKSTLFFW